MPHQIATLSDLYYVESYGSPFRALLEKIVLNVPANVSNCKTKHYLESSLYDQHICLAVIPYNKSV